MKKRLLFHFMNFVVLCLFIVAAGVFYHQFSPYFQNKHSQTLMEFLTGRWHNFVLIAVFAYFLLYLTGLVKFTIEDKHFRIANYLREIFKLLLILGMVSFVEFFVFFDTKIGRLIYLYIFILYSIYYLTYLAIRSHRGPRKLIWLAGTGAEEILGKYINRQDFSIIQPKPGNEVQQDLNVHVVYQDGSITEDTSESLIKNKLAGNTVIELVELIEKESGKIPVDYVNIHWFLEKFEVKDRNFFRISRFFNIMMSIVLLILLFPVGFFVALIHKVFSRGPIFFVQERLGLHGRTFKLIKFRTMVREAEKYGARFAQRNDPRITPLGKFMRRLRLDEIPQLVNVLKGNMSLVGPRPEREIFIDSLSRQLPYYKLRLLVPPGLTGWAQINGVYAGNDVQDHKSKLEYDLYYIKNRSIVIDLLILVRTIKTIVQAKGE